LKKNIAIIGGGAAALMLAASLHTEKYTVSIYEKNAALGRKFLVAGDGGFNLTHSENINDFTKRYTPASFLQKAIQSFTNNDFIDWLHHIGIPTFVGTSNRIYPIKGMKPIEVLQAFIKILKDNNVIIHTKYNWTGWNENGHLIFENKEPIKTDIVLFALGGASWKVTGSTGEWLPLFTNKNIKTLPFQASNCAYYINWKEEINKIYEGKPLKNIAITCNDNTKKGEVVITKNGLEGGAIYALSPQIRNQLNTLEKAIIFMDLKPNFSINQITKKLQEKGNKSITDTLKNVIKLSSASIGLLKCYVTKMEFNNMEILASKIKHIPIEITGAAPIDEAISTVGGIAIEEVNENFELLKLPNHYVIGEMLNWDAPTGGYLLQACMSVGHYVATHLNNKKF
jgi:uncharacterized flavoprotein (TIGR03862 family)